MIAAAVIGRGILRKLRWMAQRRAAERRERALQVATAGLLAEVATAEANREELEESESAASQVRGFTQISPYPSLPA